MRNRVDVLPSVLGAELHIRAKREWGGLIFIPVWLTFWTFGGVMAMKWVLHPGPSTSRAFILLWLLGWAAGETWAVYQWFWTAFGKEIVLAKEGALTVKRDVLGLGRTRSFPIGSVANLRACGVFPSTSYWDTYLAQMKLGGGSVGFDIQGQIVRFRIQLTEPEAQDIVRQLKPYLPG